MTRLASPPGNSRRISSSPRRDSAPGGNEVASPEPTCRCRKGSPKRSKRLTTGTNTRQGCTITVVASRCQKPSPPRSVSRNGTRSEFTRGPSTASSAGKVVRP